MERWKRSRRSGGVSLVRRVAIAMFVALVGIPAIGPIITASGAAGCAAGLSRVACENQLPGDPPSDWMVPGAGSPTIQGFATAMSVNVGQTESFKINTVSTKYHIDILRIGYYQGNGARKIVSNMTPSVSLPQTQPPCLSDASTGLVDCGNWGASASWTVPTDAVSGVYVAHLVREDAVADAQIVFVVRDDASHSDLLYQTSDTTWQAYNTYGGNSLYVGNPAGRAYKVSYNRPFDNANGTAHDFFFDAEYSMVRFLEANGYDISYTSGADVDRTGALLLNHKVFVSSGHDEYWSGAQRAHVESARDAGVNLAFFSGNEVFWKTRWEPSIDGSNSSYRTLVSYKETHANALIDPADPPTWTGTWRDPRFSPPADGGRPENALTGQYFIANAGTADIQVPAQYAPLRFWRNTAVAGLTAGQTLTLAPGTGTLGYEWDEDVDNGSRPAGLIDMSSTSTPAEVFTDYGNSLAENVVKTHHLTLYRAPSGALVFGAGTVQWAWGLDAINPSRKPADLNMQQATVNLLADMGAQPTTIESGLVPATKSTDTIAPGSTITSPTAGASFADGVATTITGTATDSGGGVVAGVEVSTDGGTTWHPATGTTNWTYQWSAAGSPSTTVLSRATDDSGNVETPRPGTSVNVGCPCSVWAPNATPSSVDSNDGHPIEVGVKFTSDAAGFVRSVRFYKAATNTGTHTAELWSAGGALLGTATFTGETASGWQQADFASPIAINANTTYIASYYAPKGHYSETEGYFYGPPSQPDTYPQVDSPPLHALLNSTTVSNGVFTYSATSTFPTATFNAENYWVDVVYSPTTGPVPVPGAPINVVATAGPASAQVSWNAPTSGGPVTTYTVTPFIGSVAQPATAVTGTPPTPSTTVNGLNNGTTYTFTVTASNSTGSGATSTSSNSVVPSPPPPPGSPSGATASAGSGLAAVTWSAPTSGGAVTSYTITPFVGSVAQTPTTITGTPPATSTIVSGLTNGTTYTFTVTASNNIGHSAPSAASNAVTPSPSPPILVDKTVSVDGSGTVSTAAFGTTLPGEMLVALVSADGPGSTPQTSAVTGGGLTWTLDQRANSQAGDAEIWHTFAPTPLTNAVVTSSPTGGLDQSLTVVALSGASGIGAHVSGGARTGAPSVSLTTLGSGSLVYVTGNDYDHATARAVAAGQTMTHQWVDTGSGDTFWAQGLSAPAGSIGSTVTMADTAPTADRWNFAAVEIERPAVVAKTDQSISFAPLADATLAQSPVTVGATASSGLAVSFSSATTAVCSVAGTSVTLLTPGTCTVEADQAGNPSFNAAAAVQQSFNVTTAPQSITFAPLPGVPLSVAAINASATASSGLAVSFSSTTSSVCSVSGSTVTLATIGFCTIQADQAGNASFGAAPSVAQTFLVTGAPSSQTIAFTPIADTSLSFSPVVASASASSGLPVTFSSTTTGVCTVSGSSVTLVTTGTCTIQADQAGNGAFLAAPSVQSSFAVLKSDQAIVFGSMPAVTPAQSPVTASASATSGLPVSFSSITPSVCSVAGSSVSLLSLGICTIQADQGGNASFNAAPSVQQGFFVNALSDQTITFNNPGNATLAQSPVAVSASTSSGLPVVFSSTTTGVCTVSGSAVTLVAAGTCTIEADQSGNSSFNPAPPVQQSFTVTKVAQTITFVAISGATLGQPPVTVTAATSSGLPVSLSSVTPTVCSVSGSTAVLLATGTCTLQGDQAGNAFYGVAPSVQQSFAVSPTPTGVVIDQAVFKDARGTATTAAFSTTRAGDVLVAFVGTDGPTSGQTMTVSGAGLTWTFVKRTNSRGGDAEVWTATAPGVLTNVAVTSTASANTYDQSLTVVAFAGASGVGASATANAAKGAPSVSLKTTKAGSWVFGVGNDWNRATARTVGSGQTMVHQWVDTTSGDTYWTQSTTAPTAASGTTVAISDTAPTADRWNFTAVEVLAS